MTATPDGRDDGTGEEQRGIDRARDFLFAEQTLATALQRARGALLWERVWPALVAFGMALGLFLIVSWSGLWLALPPWARIVGVALFAILTAVALVPALRVRVPSASDALGRLDRASNLPHRPATALADHLASKPDDPVGAALWRAHINRMAGQIGRLRAGVPAPRLAALDPRAFRALVALGVIATFFMAPGEHVRRIASAFDWHTVVAPPPYRVDAWVDPPAYTGRAPLMLPGLRSNDGATAGAAEAAPAMNASALSVPAGSVLVVRVTGLDKAPVAVEGGVAVAPTEQDEDAQEDADKTPPPESAARKPQPEQRYVIAGDGAAHLTGPRGDSVSWRFTAVPDRAPTISFAKEPQASGRTAIALSYKVEDDYGVTAAEAKFKATPPATRLHALKNAAPPAEARPLVGLPDFALPLPGARARSGVGQTTRDFTESPWAGVRVTMQLVARDDAGNTGMSESRTFLLPARNFSNPLARALIEQRRKLALDANAREGVGAALGALAIAPERFTPNPAHYMGLRTAYWRLDNARSDDDLRGVVDYLWEIAVRIEDGEMSDVEKQLRAAQENLQNALERGASDEEIQRLTQELREAMEEFMQALAKQAQRNGDMANQQPMDPNTRTVRPQDLQKMLDRIEEMARNGARDAARQMLSELQNMLNGLQAGRQQQRRQGQNQMSQALDELGDMIRQQQRLRDRTFQEGQQGEQGQQGQQGQAFNDLKQNQEQLREQLRQLREKMQQAMRQGQQGQEGQQGQQGQQGQRGQQGQQGQSGQGEGGEFGQALGEAEQAMREAEGALGEGEGGSAVDAQNQALQALRQGAQSMAQAMQQQQGPGGQEPGGPSGQTAERTDPLGRPMRSRDYGDDVTVKVPDEVDVQRARRVLEELRRRFGEGFRPRMELDYLERLLRDY